ncbi:MAG: bifunctional UDP-N-acetylglucosamine diphosphorylase/glucosamine-1-phosphate N-acetyltransferase GlmU [Chloroflexota bacterium]|nr:bifunctional UDP-N-acetylglucosamine diphosphorylase/glucosamine-1-phosphate N-acetyltransferase GlmU [Chloroflexota bacterium]
MKNFEALVLAAGKGTRMNSRLPKVLHSICGREMVNIVLDIVNNSGVSSTTLVIPPNESRLKSLVGDRTAYIEQVVPLGTGDAVKCALDDNPSSENLMILCGDMPLILPETLVKMRVTHSENNSFVTVLTGESENTNGMGRIVRNHSGSIEAIVEENDADASTLMIKEVNLGVYCFRYDWLSENLENLKPSASGELYLTDLVTVAVEQGLNVASVQPLDATETMGINNRVELAEAENIYRRRLRTKWMLEGVTMTDPETVYLDHDVELGTDVVLLPNTHISDGSRISDNCVIGPNSVISHSTIGQNTEVKATVIEDSVLEENVKIGPFSHVRPGSRIGSGVKLGNFVEIKNSTIGSDTKSGHFSFIGDANVGSNVNIGAGTVTVNYDGSCKHRTNIGDRCFIGCDTMLIAPVNVGSGADTGAGSVVKHDVPPDSRVVGVPARQIPRKK